jgi:hypothetical protein
MTPPRHDGSVVLLRLAYLSMTNVFAILRLLPMSDRDKDVEILALRHQISVLERQLSGQQVKFTAGDRAFLAALLHQLPTHVLRRMRLLARPDTVLRRHRDLVARRHAAQSRPKSGGRPRTVHSIRALALCLARKNPNYRRLHGELLVLGVKAAASTVWEILQEAGIGPAPERASSTCLARRDGRPEGSSHRNGVRPAASAPVRRSPISIRTWRSR